MMNSRMPHFDTPAPSCSIIIPTRDKPDLVAPCIDSVLRSKYSGKLELMIIDNGSTDPRAVSYLNSVADDPRVRLIKWNQSFNFSQINNMAARAAIGDVLCFLNNDTVIISPEWLEVLARAASLPDAGAVGALLLYPDKTIQHAGIALDSVRVGMHISRQRYLHEFSESCEMDRWYGVDAVTAACMFTRRQLFLDVGGFDEALLPVGFNDVDYCLRLRAMGYPSLICPAIQLFHHESMTRKSDDLPENQTRALKEWQTMVSRWKLVLEGRSYNEVVPWFTGSEPTADNGNACTVSSELQIRAIKSALLPPPLPVQSIEQPATEEPVEMPVEIPLENRYEMLQIEYNALESYAKSLQNELNIIHNSRFWRFTSPVRRIFYLLRRCKEKAGLALVSSATGRKLYTWLKNADTPAKADEQPATRDTVKEQYSQAAHKQLSDFLQSARTLNFPCPEQPQLSIILVLYNQAHLTLLCLQSIVDHAGSRIEVIIVDNNSTDQSRDLLENIRGAKVIRNPENLGFVDAVNQGAEIATGNYLLLLNNDALLQPGSLAAALDVFASEDNVGAVGGKITLLDNSLQEAGSLIWRDGSCLGYGRGKAPDSPEFMFRRDVDYCSGAFLMTPRALFEKLGGFDPDYAPAYYEESDYCIRLKKAGYRIVYEPFAEIIHYEFASSGGYAGASRLQQEHRVILLEKHRDYLESHHYSAPENILAARSADHSKRILLIDDRVPHANLGSGYPRCREIIHELTDLNFSITLYPLRTPVDDWTETYSTLPRRVEVMLNLGPDGLAHFLAQRQGYYDFIIVSRSHNMVLFREITDKNPALIQGTRIIYDAEALTAPREAARLRLLGESISPAREQSMVNAELDLSRDADWIIAVSEAEADIYRNAGLSSVLVLGHKSTAQATGNTFNDRRDLLFVGALRDDNSPNVDSVLWFCDEVLPLLQEKLHNTPAEEFQVLIVGGNSAPSLRYVTSAGVRFLGQQDDITALYNHCRIFIAPTRFAAGIPHKIHEAAAYGVPVVCTQLLADQLSWHHERELLSATTAEQFAEQCARLYTDEALWNSLRATALTAMQKDCSPETFRQQLKRLFSD